MSAACRRNALVPVLIFTTMVAAIVSSLGAPLIPTISRQFHVSVSSAQWSLTVALLAGAISAPIMGRLGDGPRRRETLIAGLVAVALGGVVAALATSLAVLVLGRALQGIGLGLVPLTMAAAREHLPAKQVPKTIALLSVCAAAGVGAGYPISGLIADTLGLSAAFWFGTLVSGVALLAAFAVLPSSSHRPSAKLDVLGALLLTFGLGALLLAVAQGNTWHWTSARICGLLALCAAAFASWIYQQLHKSAPLVELRLLRHRVVLTSDGCAVVLGVAMYMYISAVTEFVQTSRSVGYGFSASIVVAGFCLVPFSIFSFAASRTLPWCTELVGERALLPFGSLIVAAPGAFLALFHTSLWEAFVAMGMLGIGVGLTYAAIPGMIVSAVPESETGSAMGFYQVVRYVGFSFGSALTASVLSGHTSAGRHLPNESGFTLVFWIACGICLLAATIAWILPHRGTPTVREVLLGEEDAELAGAGLVGLTQR